MLPFAVACVAPFIRCTDDLIAFALAARSHIPIIRAAARDYQLAGSRSLFLATHLRVSSLTEFVVVARGRTPWLRDVHVERNWLWSIAEPTRVQAALLMQGVITTVQNEYLSDLLYGHWGDVIIGSIELDPCLDLRRMRNPSDIKELRKFLRVVPQRIVVRSLFADARAIHKFVRDPQCDIVVDMIDWHTYPRARVAAAHRDYHTIERATRTQAPGARVVFIIDRAYRRWWLRQWGAHTTSSCRDRTRIHTRGSIDIWWSRREHDAATQATLDLLHRTPVR